MRVLTIDDNPDDRQLVLHQLKAEFPNAEAVELSDMAGLERELAAGAPDLVVTDLDLRWASGLDILDRIKAVHPDCPVVMFTGTGNEETAVDAMKRGLDDYIVKSPRQLRRLRASLRQVVDNAGRRIELRRSREKLAEREKDLEAALAHKDLLLRELHHRVKNNLQTVNSILWMRAKRADDPRLAAELEEVASRMTALAQVQSRILDDGDLDRVDFRAVLDDMAGALSGVYADGRVTLTRRFDGPLVLGVGRAMPLGLLCYEFLLNSFKHAFPERRRGELTVETRTTGAKPEIRVSDDGIGYDESLVQAGFGSRLTRGLALEANVEVERLSRPNDGTSVTLRLL